MLRLFKINGGAVMLDRQYMIKDKKILLGIWSVIG